jgi:hypothetical protein
MSTTDDVFWLYERNKTTEYIGCVKSKKQCPNLYNNVCYCCPEDIVLPITIGDQTVPCRFKVKTYIKINEECCICLEIINNKNNAHITECGHSYHKKCLFDLFENKWLTLRRTPCVLKCPICRKNIKEPEFDRYMFDGGNYLDKLENFWIVRDYTIPKLCLRNKNHFIGMEKNCEQCTEYRNTGKWYDD